jgi:hypothetical protein
MELFCHDKDKGRVIYSYEGFLPIKSDSGSPLESMAELRNELEVRVACVGVRSWLGVISLNTSQRPRHFF